MSSYSNVTPRIIDPVFDRSNRAEFRLPAGNVYLSSMRLINIGAVTATAATNYNPVLGALCAIKSLTLFDGSEQLDTLRLAPLILAMKNLNRRNDENLSMNRFLKSVGLGYVTSGQYSTTNEALDKDDVQVRQQNPRPEAQAVAATQQKAWISLKDLLSFLGASLVVPTTIYRQLRLVIEFNDAAELKFLLSKTNAAAPASINDTLLLVDEVNDGDMKDMLMKNYKGVVYHPIETDQVRYTGTGTGADTAAENQPEVESNFLMNGFNGKKLKRLMIYNQPTDTSLFENANTLVGYGPLASVAGWKSNIQIRVNGSDILPSSGVGSSETGSCGNRRLAHAVDAWGEQNVYQGQNFTALPNQDNFIGAGGEAGKADPSLREALGQADLFGVRVDQHIRELQLRYSRTGVFGNTATTQPIDVALIGQVEKAVSLNSDGSYVVAYV